MSFGLRHKGYYVGAAPAVTAAITGTITPTATETEIVNGGETIIITIANDIWVAAGATFDAQRQNIINGLDAASTPTNGWNNEVRDKAPVTDVIRTSDTVVTITLSAQAGYNITVAEIITVTVPATALVTSTVDVVGTPTFSITPVAVSGRIMGGLVGPGGLVGRSGGLAA